jgi:hypothetical protein
VARLRNICQVHIDPLPPPKLSLLTVPARLSIPYAFSGFAQPVQEDRRECWPLLRGDRESWQAILTTSSIQPFWHSEPPEIQQECGGDSLCLVLL